MKTLYESILKSTGSGKHARATVDYLLKHGFEEYDNPNSSEWGPSYYHKKTGLLMDPLDDPLNKGFAFDIEDEDPKTSFARRRLAYSIADVELAIKWKQSHNHHTKDEDKLFKQVEKLNDIRLG